MKFALVTFLVSMALIHLAVAKSDDKDDEYKINTDVLDVIIAIETAPRYGPVRCNGDMGPGYGKLAHWLGRATSEWKLDDDHVRVALVRVGPQNGGVSVVRRFNDEPSNIAEMIKTNFANLSHTESPQPDEIAVIDEIRKKTLKDVDGDRREVPNLLIFVSVCNGGGILTRNLSAEEWALRADIAILAVKYNDDSIDPIPVYIHSEGVESSHHLKPDEAKELNKRIADLMAACKYKEGESGECKRKKNRCVRTVKRTSQEPDDKKFCLGSNFNVDETCDLYECGMTTTASDPTIRSERTSTTSADHSSNPATAAPHKTKPTDRAAVESREEKKPSDDAGMPIWLIVVVAILVVLAIVITAVLIGYFAFVKPRRARRVRVHLHPVGKHGKQAVSVRSASTRSMSEATQMSEASSIGGSTMTTMTVAPSTVKPVADKDVKKKEKGKAVSKPKLARQSAVSKSKEEPNKGRRKISESKKPSKVTRR